ncbi:LysR family transcriptional regulator [Tateyamaria sp. Alg231-49]|uniref:LysR family transcriptional regulator n=1 Tax=Tateyamaria sp. Alg231-49 TaxID=1922219 RepID=UPI000D555005|nr:LysR family transcriptional regulator [Tateyamaria sp. Alg231-49]
MDMQWLDDVLALLEEGNMTRAAARRNITQPAFSRRIRSFEDWLGTPVIDRKTNRIDISPALQSNEVEIRALMSRMKELRTKIAHHDAAASTIAISAQHAPVYSTFPDMALRARTAFPQVRFRVRPGNLSDCVALFLRGDTNMLLCYEAEGAMTLQFGPNVVRGKWGNDYLIPVVGGALRYTIRDTGTLPSDTPAIVYPENSSFGALLHKRERPFGTQAHSANPVCETAFSSGIREMVLNGLGVGWLPFSMAYREIETGDLISLANRLGQEPLEVAVYADSKNDMAASLLELWAK